MDFNSNELYTRTHTATKCINGNSHSIINIEETDLNVSF